MLSLGYLGPAIDVINGQASLKKHYRNYDPIGHECCYKEDSTLTRISRFNLCDSSKVRLSIISI